MLHKSVCQDVSRNSMRDLLVFVGGSAGVRVGGCSKEQLEWPYFVSTLLLSLSQVIPAVPMWQMLLAPSPETVPPRWPGGRSCCDALICQQLQIPFLKTLWLEEPTQPAQGFLLSSHPSGPWQRKEVSFVCRRALNVVPYVGTRRVVVGGGRKSQVPQFPGLLGS